MCDADGRITSGLVFVPVNIQLCGDLRNKPSSYKLWRWLIELSLAPATIGALARILTNREQDSGRREEILIFCSYIALCVFERRRTLPRVDGEIGGQQAQEKVTARSF